MSEAAVDVVEGKELTMRYHAPSSSPIPFTTVIVIILLVLLAMILCHGCASPETQPTADNTQTSFDSPDQAVLALVDALRANDTQALGKILGPGSDDIISSGDDVADAGNRQQFLTLYDEKHSIATNNNGSRTIVVGSDDWPLPIPLTSDGHVWRFDTSAGRDEILNRRIGRNELSAIQVCMAIVDAQREYVSRNPENDDVPTYAQKFFSDPGRRNGLFWETDEGEATSPLGPLAAEAADEGYTQPGPTTTPATTHPYHGYRYRMLKSQGVHAAGGACDYVVNGKMIGGFAVVAYPADYGNSGIMTFIINHDGVVYQKDLGDDTQATADSMAAFDPDETWTKVQP
jgi:Protein of unknown function (DUF2950)